MREGDMQAFLADCPGGQPQRYCNERSVSSAGKQVEILASGVQQQRRVARGEEGLILALRGDRHRIQLAPRLPAIGSKEDGQVAANLIAYQHAEPAVELQRIPKAALIRVRKNKSPRPASIHGFIETRESAGAQRH